MKKSAVSRRLMIVLPLLVAFSFLPVSSWGPPAAFAATEICNSLDDDGDGLVDEGYDVGAACSVAESNGCKTGGIKICTAGGGGTACQRNGPPVQASPETLGTARCFDGYDNDCDNQADWNDADCQTANEAGLCNGLDDDRDGAVDEDFPGLGGPCTAGTGFCSRAGTTNCAADGNGTRCSAVAGEPSTENTPGAARCLDGIDNDCDGAADIADAGCRTAERCDGVDNDGDGAVDENFPLLSTPCQVGTGVCEQTGAYVCNAGGSAAECSVLPGVPGTEGPLGETCADGLDNDCDGTVDLNDPDCASAELVVTCLLRPVKGNSGKGKGGEPATDCGGKYEVFFSSNAAQDDVRADILALNADGTLIGFLPVASGETAHLTSRIDPADFRLDDTGPFLTVFAPVPLLRVVADTGQRTATAYCSPIPYLEVVQPGGEVVSTSEGDRVEVLVAIPQANPRTLSIAVDGADLLSLLGIDPATAFPGGPYGGVVVIRGRTVTVSGLTVRSAPLGSASANSLTLALEGLGGGGHIVAVDAAPLPGAVRSPSSSQCLIDDVYDRGTVSIFGLEITSPLPGETTDTIPVPVTGQVLHGRPIAATSVNGVPVDPAAQIFTPGDGVTSADEYVLPFQVFLPRSNFSGGAPPQPGAIDRGQNLLNAGAEDDLGNLTFARLQFTLGSTLRPEGLASSAPAVSRRWQVVGPQDAQLPSMENAVVFGLVESGLDTFFQSTCDKAYDPVNAALQDKLLNTDFPTQEVPVDLACNPTVDINSLNVALNGNFTCDISPQDGHLDMGVTLPQVQVDLAVTGQCRDESLGICWSEVIVNVGLTAYVDGAGLGFEISEDLAKDGGAASPTFNPGSINIPEPSAGVEINCLAGFIEDVLQFFTFGLLDIEAIISDKVEEKLTISGDIQEIMRESSHDPIEIKKISLAESPITAISGLGMSQDLADVNITTAGVAGAISLSFSASLLEPGLDWVPEAPDTVAPAPSLPVAGAGEIFFALSDDTFNLLYAGITARGALRAECAASGLTFLDVLPANCGTLTTPKKRGQCEGAKGTECTALPLLERDDCKNAKDTLAARNISATTPLLFCARQGIAPRLLVEDNAGTAGTVEGRIHFNDMVVNVVLDRDADGALDGTLAVLRGCFSVGSDPTQDCVWGDTCFDLDVATNLTLATGTGGQPQIVSTLDGVTGAPVGQQCAGGRIFGDDTGLLAGAGASDPVEVVGENLSALTPLFQADGLDLNGFAKLTNPRLIAIETAVEPDCTTCQEYVGVTGTLAKP